MTRLLEVSHQTVREEKRQETEEMPSGSRRFDQITIWPIRY